MATEYENSQKLAALTETFEQLFIAGETADVTYNGVTKPSFDKRLKGVADSVSTATETYASTADALSNGVYSLDSLVAGSGGTDGTFALAFSGGAGSGAAGWFTVVSGAVSVYQITARGRGYTSAPTVSFAASSGLSGASATAVIAPNRGEGDYFSVPSGAADEYSLQYLVTAGPVATATGKALINATSQYVAKPMLPDSGYVWAVVDSSDKAALLIKPDGSVVIPKADFLTQIDTYLPTDLLPDSGYVWAVVDGDGRVGLGITPSGVVKGNFDTGASAESYKYLAPTNDLWAIGDSLTAASAGWFSQLEDDLGFTRSYQNYAHGGQTSVQQAAKSGAIPALLSVASDAVPASGSVAITALSTLFLSSPASTSGSKSQSGWLGGVYGEITCVHDAGNDDAADVYTFTRNTAGDSTYLPPNSPWVPDVNDGEFKTILICVGTNNIGNTADIIRDVQAIVGVQKTIDKRFLIITPVNSSPKTATVPPDTTHVSSCETVEAALVALYSDKVLRVREYSYQFNSGSADDLADVAAGCVPRSLRSDDVHWTDSFHTQIKNWVLNEITRRAW